MKLIIKKNCAFHFDHDEKRRIYGEGEIIDSSWLKGPGQLKALLDMGAVVEVEDKVVEEKVEESVKEDEVKEVIEDKVEAAIEEVVEEKIEEVIEDVVEDDESKEKNLEDIKIALTKLNKKEQLGLLAKLGLEAPKKSKEADRIELLLTAENIEDYL